MTELLPTLLTFVLPILILSGVVVGLKGALDMSRGYYGAASNMVGGLGLSVAAGVGSIYLPEILSLYGIEVPETAKAKSEPKAAPDIETAPSGGGDQFLGISTETLLLVMGGLFAVGILIGMVVGLVSYTSSRRRMAVQKREVLAQATAEEQARLDRVWAESVERHDTLREESMQHQSDIDLVLSLPLINDMSEPKTMAFIEALAKATDLVHDTRPSSPTAVEAYAAATRAAERAWGVAWRNADRVRLSHFDPTERATIKKVTGLMKMAQRGSTAEERRSYYVRAVTMLDHLVEIPAPAAEAIEMRVAGVLANPHATSEPILAQSPLRFLVGLTRKKSRTLQESR